MSGALKNYFLTPKVRFLSLIWLPRHFLHLTEDMGFFTPHLKQTLKKSLRCWAICFFVASVIGKFFSSTHKQKLDLYLSISVMRQSDS